MAPTQTNPQTRAAGGECNRRVPEYATVTARMHMLLPIQPREPLAVVVSGGGFVSMTGGMAVARALSDAGLGWWEKVTHLGGNSGGAWFGTQFIYSQRFHDAVTSNAAPLRDVVSEWIESHIAAQARELHSSEWGPQGLLPAEHGCPLTNLEVRQVISRVAAFAETPYFRYLPFVAGTVLNQSIDSVANATYATAPRALPAVALVQAVTLPPDAWTTYDRSVGHTRRAGLRASFADGRTLDLSERGKALPLAFVSEAGSKQGWWFNADITRLDVFPLCPHADAIRAEERQRCALPPYRSPRAMPLPLRDDPLLAEVAAATGGAAGFAGSPSLYRRLMGGVEREAPRPAVRAPNAAPGRRVLCFLARPLIVGASDCAHRKLLSVWPAVARPAAAARQAERRGERGGRTVPLP